MTRREDDFTTTVEAAAAFERIHGESNYDVRDERPSRDEADRDEWELAGRPRW